MSKENRVSDERLAELMRLHPPGSPMLPSRDVHAALSELQSLRSKPVAGDLGELIAWLQERAKPDSGMEFGDNSRGVAQAAFYGSVAAVVRLALEAADAALTAEAENRGDVDEDYEANVGPALAKVRNALAIIGTSSQPEAVITEEMVERAMKAYWAGDAGDGTGKTSMRAALNAALKEA